MCIMSLPSCVCWYHTLPLWRSKCLSHPFLDSVNFPVSICPSTYLLGSEFGNSQAMSYIASIGVTGSATAGDGQRSTYSSALKEFERHLC